MTATATLDQKVWIIGTDAERQAMSPGAGAQFFAYDTGLGWVRTGEDTWVTSPFVPGASGGGSTPATGVPGTVARVRATLNSVSPGVIAAAGDYAAGDVLNNSAVTGLPWIFPGAARIAGAGGVAQKILITASVAALVPRFRWHFFNALPTVLQADNAAFLLDADDRAKYLGYVDMPAMQTSGSSEVSWSEADISWIFQTAAATSLWAVLQTLDAFTNESAGMTIDAYLTAVQN